MADNVAITAGSGTSVATDQLAGGEHVQYVKLMDGTADSSAKIGGDATNGLDVDVTRVQGTVTIGDGGSTISVDDGAGSLTVDGTVTVQDGGNVISVDDGAGSLTIDNAALSVTGGGVEASALRVTLASDSTGVLSVDDNGSTLSIDDGGGNISIDDGGNSITVDGTVAVSGTVAVTDNAGSLTVDNAGTFAVQVDGAALTALQLIDNPVLVDDAAFTPATSSVMMAGFEFDDAAPDSVNEGDAGAARMSANRNIYVQVRDAAGNERGLNVDASGNIGVTDAGSSLTVDNAALSVTGGGVEASALRVTIANDSTGVLSVDDNGGSLTVDGTVAVSSISTSVTPGTAAANLGKAEDAAHSSGDVGVMMLAVRQDANASLVGTDLDYAPLQVNSGGSLKVVITGGAGSGGTSAVDDAAFTVATDAGTPIMGYADVTTIDAVNEGDVGVVGMTLNRALFVNLRDEAGNELSVGGGTQYTEDAAAAANPVGNALNLIRDDARGGSLTTTDGDNVAARGTNAGELYVKHVDAIPVTDNGGSLTVDGTVTANLAAGTNNIGDVDVLSVVPGTGATALGKAEDAAHTTGDTGVYVLAVRDDSLAAHSGADGDYESLHTDANGALWVKHSGNIDVNSHAVTNAGTFAVQESGAALTALQKIDDPVFVDDAAFTPGTSSVMMIGAQLDNTTPDSVDEGDAGALRMSANRNLFMNIRDAAGNERGANVNASNQLSVSVDNTVTVGSHAVTNAGTFAVQVDGNALTALQLIDDPVVADDAAFTPGTTKVMMAGFEADESSTDSVDEGDGGAARMTLDRKVIVNPQPHTAGGLSIFRSLDLDETEEDVKTSAGQVYGWFIANTATSTRFVKFYNATAANTTVGSTTPVMTLPIPGNSSDDVAAHVMGAHGIVFDTAICVAATTGVADADTGAPAANDVIINIWYK